MNQPPWRRTSFSRQWWPPEPGATMNLMAVQGVGVLVGCVAEVRRVRIDAGVRGNVHGDVPRVAGMAAAHGAVRVRIIRARRTRRPAEVVEVTGGDRGAGSGVGAVQVDGRVVAVQILVRHVAGAQDGSSADLLDGAVGAGLEIEFLPDRRRRAEDG